MESPWLVVSLQLVSGNEALSGEECSNPVTQDAEMNRVDVNPSRHTAIKLQLDFNSEVFEHSGPKVILANRGGPSKYQFGNDFNYRFPFP